MTDDKKIDSILLVRLMKNWNVSRDDALAIIDQLEKDGHDLRTQSRIASKTFGKLLRVTAMLPEEDQDRVLALAEEMGGDGRAVERLIDAIPPPKD